MNSWQKPSAGCFHFLFCQPLYLFDSNFLLCELTWLHIVTKKLHDCIKINIYLSDKGTLNEVDSLRQKIEERHKKLRQCYTLHQCTVLDGQERTVPATGKISQVKGLFTCSLVFCFQFPSKRV